MPHRWSGLLNLQDLPVKFLERWVAKGGFAWLVTADILDEYKEVARRLKARLSVAGHLINLLNEEAEEVAVESVVEISRDPGDNVFCACAQEGRANFLVILNPRDFPQGKLLAKVVSPFDLLKVLRLRRRLG
jgi:putative PIN family toxin of toxin-antitoxin system